MIKGNYFTENADLMAHFEHFTDWEKIVGETEGGFSEAKKYAETEDERFAYAPTNVEEALEFYKVILNSFGDLSGNEVSQEAQAMDLEGLKYEDGKVIFPDKYMQLWKKFKEAGLVPYSLGREWGGQGLPLTVISMISEVLSRADISFCMALGCANLAEVVAHFGSEEQKNEWLPKMSSGDYTGAMALSEPNYGSDLSSVMTKAEKQEDGTYLLNGTKRFITHGCGIGEDPSVILTLARTGSPTSGARGLSFFIVDSNDVEVIGIEHKLGIKCSPTCEVAYENTPATIIGAEGSGLTKYAMAMMNGARIGVASLSVGLGEATYREALKYAEEREQFGKAIKEIPAVKKILDRMERESVAMRALNMEAAFTCDMYSWRTARLTHEGKTDREIRKDDQVGHWNKLASLFTPLAKFYTSEMANSLAYDAIQIYGGSGFVEEYDVARLYRDARILSIYEGTSQLQVVGAIGGIVAGMNSTGQLREYLNDLTSSFKPSSESKELGEVFEKAVEVYKSIEDSDEKALVAWEVVAMASRYVNGLLLERNADKLEGDAKNHYLDLSGEYNIDSLAEAQAYMVRLESTLKKNKSQMKVAS